VHGTYRYAYYIDFCRLCRPKENVRGGSRLLRLRGIGILRVRMGTTTDGRRLRGGAGSGSFAPGHGWTSAMGSPSRRRIPETNKRRQRMERGAEIIRHGIDALTRLCDGLDEEFSVATARLAELRGCLIVCGIGKAGLIGRKLAATFASTGTRSHFLHPSEALHGDLGCIGASDWVLILSNSGATKEILDLLPFVSRKAAGVIAITSNANSPLARAADIALILPFMKEACQHNLAPTTSTIAMLALGDALAMVVSEAKGFRVEDFAELHPGGSLGRKLASVDDAMRPIGECRVSREGVSIRHMLVEVSKPGRRTGAIMITDAHHKLKGIFTDSDLAKLLEQGREADLDRHVDEIMTTTFSAVHSGARLSEAMELMKRRKISELPVVNANDEPMGMLDITDLLGLEPWEADAGTETACQPDRTPGHPHLAHRDDAEGNEEGWLEEPTTLRIFGPLK